MYTLSFKNFNQNQTHNTMEDHMNDSEDTISLSDLQFEDDNIGSETVSKGNQSSTFSFDQDFLGFFSEEWSRYSTSSEDIIFCGKIVSSKQSVSRDRKPETSSETTQLFRSNSDSFRIMKTDSRQSTPRSKSLPNRLPSSSSCKSKWKVFMFGFGSGKFPTTMDMSDIKSRQLRRQSEVSVDDGKEVSVGWRSGKKGRWWLLVDVLGCSGGYERDTLVVI
ncbi:hypothetical protein L1987_35046 [Smallanthus sonchifolius]|uniref:Uncharacterized protein n=1 Tax=Smallanthus sonchifolius TaxID=185202 RepID=A0ACB9HX92_9ASTR|nr:hypothetical protein L1987_35046 [Smallanthus sonchifolius]